MHPDAVAEFGKGLARVLMSSGGTVEIYDGRGARTLDPAAGRRFYVPARALLVILTLRAGVPLVDIIASPDDRRTRQLIQCIRRYCMRHAAMARLRIPRLREPDLVETLAKAAGINDSDRIRDLRRVLETPAGQGFAAAMLNRRPEWREAAAAAAELHPDLGRIVREAARSPALRPLLQKVLARIAGIESNRERRP